MMLPALLVASFVVGQTPPAAEASPDRVAQLEKSVEQSRAELAALQVQLSELQRSVAAGREDQLEVREQRLESARNLSDAASVLADADRLLAQGSFDAERLLQHAQALAEAVPGDGPSSAADAIVASREALSRRDFYAARVHLASAMHQSRLAARDVTLP